MRESATSLRLYFGFIGLLYVAFLFFGLMLGASLVGMEFVIRSFLSSPLELFMFVVNTIFDIGYLYFAFTLPSYLNPERVAIVKNFLIASFAVSVLGVLIKLMSSGSISIFGLAISGLVTWYLYSNVTRIATPPSAPLPPEPRDGLTPLPPLPPKPPAPAGTPLPPEPPKV